MRGHRRTCAAGLAAMAMLIMGGAITPGAAANVLLVCPQPGSSTTCPNTAYASIQGAVNAAASGDWVLVAPGDYHEQGVPGAAESAGVLVQTPGLHLRGMDRNAVIVDGTKPGSAGPCPSDQASQDTA